MYISRAIAIFAIATILSIAILTGAAQADDTQLNNWGNSLDSRSPHPDSKDRSGHWWWPDPSNSSGYDQNVGGNGGRVFAKWAPLSNTATDECPAPPYPVEYPPACGYPGLRLNLILFPHDTTEIRSEGKTEIDKVVSELGKFPGDTVLCVGHTDDTGAEAYNLQLR